VETIKKNTEGKKSKHIKHCLILNMYIVNKYHTKINYVMSWEKTHYSGITLKM
jgi:hypothetical protein